MFRNPSPCCGRLSTLAHKNACFCCRFSQIMDTLLPHTLKYFAVLILIVFIYSYGVPSKTNKQYICRHYPNWGWPPSLPSYFWQIHFWHSVDHVDLPPSPRIFDKNHEILGFKTYILYYPYYFLRVRGKDRKTQSPLIGPDLVKNYTK